MATRETKGRDGNRDSSVVAIEGSVERVVYKNEDSGFSVLSVAVEGRSRPVTIVGHVAGIEVGQSLKAKGTWVDDRRYGSQILASTILPSSPKTKEGLRNYLGSGVIQGIGPEIADRLTSAFGSKVFDVMENEPERLQEIDGIGPKRVKAIIKAWQGQRTLHEIMVFLQSHGLGTARATRVFKTYGEDSVELIAKDPYRLAHEIQGIGFRSADAIAMHAGIPRTSRQRIRAGLHFLLTQAMDRGSCGVEADALVERARDLLGEEVEEQAISIALDKEVRTGELLEDRVDNRICIFAKPLFHAERRIAELIRNLMDQGLPWRAVNAGQAIPWLEKKLSVQYAPSQADAIRCAVNSKFLVVTGGPGVGKTTLVNAVLRIVTELDVNFKLCAPTGRAAKRMSEATRRPAQTIHRLLAFDPIAAKFRHDEKKPLKCDLLVVDEASMVDVQLMFALLRAVPRNSAVLLVGDADQLPSVGPGRVLADIIESGTVPVVRLTEVFRQAAESRIIVTAHNINSGRIPDLANPRSPKASDFYFVQASEPDTVVSRVLELASSRIPQKFGFDPMRDVQVLSPMVKGTVGVRSLNLVLQQRLNPVPNGFVEKFGWRFAVGDRVIQNVNNYEKQVFNGDIGFVMAAGPKLETVIVDFDGREVEFDLDELDSLMPAYAITIHKSQGSEYPAVILALTTQHFPMLQRNLLYTGITRGKRLVVLVGQKRAIEIAVRTFGRDRRLSRLKQLLA